MPVSVANNMPWSFGIGKHHLKNWNVCGEAAQIKAAILNLMVSEEGRVICRQDASRNQSINTAVGGRTTGKSRMFVSIMSEFVTSQVQLRICAHEWRILGAGNRLEKEHTPNHDR